MKALKKAAILAVAAALAAVMLCSCEQAYIHCDKCGKRVAKARETTLKEEETIYCIDCQHSLGIFID